MDEVEHPAGELPAGFPPEPELSYDPQRSQFLSGLGHSTIPPSALEHEAVQAALAQWSLMAMAQGAAAGGAEGSPNAPNAFLLEERLGAGGFGEVWAGVQCSLGREVAIKRLRDDILESARDDHDRFRFLTQVFRQEATTTAALEHPNIVPIHDLGIDEHGRPLLAMKRVRGRPWDDLLRTDFPALPVSDFLARHIPILVAVAQAVAFAHSRGIIHRDIKPSQVMVGEFGETLLMDWGLAVAVDASAKARTFQGLLPAVATPDTASSPAGTAGYMAPEQTLPTAAKVGFHTDVYLLGATLFKVLTNEPPHRGTIPGEAFAKARAGLCGDPRKVVPHRELPADLLELMTEALQPEIERRTLTAVQFVARLQDYLSGAARRREARQLLAEVEEGLPAAGGDYSRLSELLNKATRACQLFPEHIPGGDLRDRALIQMSEAALGHGDLRLARLQAERLPEGTIRGDLLARVASGELAKERQDRVRRVAVVASFVFLGLLLVLGTHFSIRLNSALQQTSVAHRNTQHALRDSVAQRDQARIARDGAEQLTHFMLSDLRNRLYPVDPHLSTLDEVAHQAGLHYEAQLKARLEDPERLRLIHGLDELAQVLFDQGKTTEAGIRLRQALEAAQRLAPRTRAEDTTRQLLGHLWDLKALVEEQTGARDEALASFGEAEKLLSGLKPASPAEAASMDSSLQSTRSNRASCLLAMGRSRDASELADEVLRARRQAYDSKPGDPTAAHRFSEALFDRAERANKMGDVATATRTTSESITICRALLRDDPTSTTVRETLATSLMAHAEAQGFQGQVAQTVRLLDEAVSLATDVVTSEPLVVRYRDALSGIHLGRSLALRQMGRFDEAIADSLKAIEIRQWMIDRDPRDIAMRHGLFGDYQSLADLYWAAGRAADAQATYRLGRNILATILKTDPSNSDWTRELAVCSSMIGECARALGRPDEATANQLECITLFKRVVELDPANPRVNRDLSVAIGKLADARQMTGDLEAALQGYLEAGAIIRPLAQSNPDNLNWQREAAANHFKVGQVLYRQGHLAQAREQYKAAARGMQEVSDCDPAQLPWKRDATFVRSIAADLETQLGEEAEALDDLRQCQENARALASTDSKMTGWHVDLSHADNALAASLSRQGDPAHALPLAAEAYAVARDILDKDMSNKDAQRELATAYAEEARALLGLGRPREALAASDLATTEFGVLLASWPGDLVAGTGRGGHFLLRGCILQALDRGDEAAAAWRQARGWADEALKNPRSPTGWKTISIAAGIYLRDPDAAAAARTAVDRGSRPPDLLAAMRSRGLLP